MRPRGGGVSHVSFFYPNRNAYIYIMEERIALTAAQLDEIREMVDSLNKSISSMLTIVDATERARAIGCDVGTALIHKNIEDGILRNLGNANSYQLEQLIMGKGYKFKYYPELNNLYEKVQSMGFEKVK